MSVPQVHYHHQDATVISLQSGDVPLLLLPLGEEGEQEEEDEQWRTVLVSLLPSLPTSLPTSLPASQSNIYHSEPANQHSVRLSQLRGFLLLPGSSLTDVRAIVIHQLGRMSTSSPKTLWCGTSPSTRPLASIPAPATSPSLTPPARWAASSTRRQSQTNPALPRLCPGPGRGGEEECPARYLPVRRTSSSQCGVSVSLSPLGVESAAPRSL